MKIALLGIGTVGSGVFNVLQKNRTLLEQKAGQPLEITHIFTRDPHLDRGFDTTNIVMTDDIQVIYDAPIDLAVEVMGGVEFTREVVRTLLSKGVSVVTANKDMLALHIDELSALANENQATLLYEASVAGGIPIINGIEVGLAANELTAVMGILNGTTNYMLTRMTQDGWSYEQALQVAQEKGYAEADPTNDVGGFDAARKITLLSRLAYQTKVDFQQVAVKGIDQVDALDIQVAQQAGYTMKLLGKSAKTSDGIQVGVEPVLLPNQHPLAGVSEAMNAVFVEGNAIGQTMFWGPGAGSLETASAVVADVVQAAQRGFIAQRLPQQQLPIVQQALASAYYLRFDSDPVHTRAVLQTLEIGYVTLADATQLIVKTEVLAPETLDRLMQNASVAAVYPMV